MQKALRVFWIFVCASSRNRERKKNGHIKYISKEFPVTIKRGGKGTHGHLVPSLVAYSFHVSTISYRKQYYGCHLNKNAPKE